MKWIIFLMISVFVFSVSSANGNEQQENCTIQDLPTDPNMEDIGRLMKKNRKQKCRVEKESKRLLSEYDVFIFLDEMWKGTELAAAKIFYGISSTMESIGQNEFGEGLRQMGDNTIEQDHSLKAPPPTGRSGRLGRFFGMYFYITIPLFLLLCYVFWKK